MTSISDDLRIVFVQLGKRPDKYVWANISMCQKWFPEFPITLIGNSSATQREGERRNIEYWDFQMDSEAEETFRSLNLPQNFRHGFWIYTLQRLIALTQYHLVNPVKSLLHVESDVTLSSNFPFSKLINENRIHWMPFNEERDVASLLYLPSQDETKWLQEEFLRNLSMKNDHTDMTLLREVSKKHPNRIMYFPVIESPHSQLLNKNSKLDFSQRASIQYEIFQGLFDAAPLGMWLTGQDPRNHRGRILRYKPIPESDVDPTTLSGRLKLEEEALMYNGDIPIYDLHIHSKERKFFSHQKNSLLRKLILGSHGGQMKSKLSVRAYLILAEGFLGRRFRRIFRHWNEI
jgi:hypothetical protein